MSSKDRTMEAQHLRLSSEEIEELTARPYQNELLEKAKKNNIIVYLGTGSGKTYIANMLIKDFRAQLKGEKKAIFLVSSLPLVDQQALSIRLTTGLSVGTFCGADGVDDWTEEEWRDRISKHQVLVLIHQVFLDALTHAYFKLSDAALLIMDECHHAQSEKDHAYTKIMRNFYHRLKNNMPERLPRVLGLTACLMVKAVSADKFHKEMRILEDIMDSRVETTTDLFEILKYVTAPKEEMCTYLNTDQYREEYNLISSHCDVALDKLSKLRDDEKLRWKNVADINLRGMAITELEKDFKEMKNKTILNILDGIIDLGLISLFLNFKGMKTQTEKRCSKALRVYYAAEVRIAMDKVMLELLRDIESVMVRIPYMETSHESLRSFTSTKVLGLMEKLKTEIDGGERRTIVFVEKQYHAETLSRIIEKFAIHDRDLVSLSTDFAFSPGSNLNVKDPKQREIINNNRQRLKETLAKFKDGRINTLIATSVIEEGLDVRTCNLVIKFDFPMTFRSYVQSKGRARAKPSKYILMVSQAESGKFVKKYNDYRQLEELSLKECHYRVEDVEPKVHVENDKPYVADPEDPESASIDGSQAVRLVHKYIQKIPVDRFTRLTPVWKYEDLTSNRGQLLAGLGLSAPGGYVATCYLPHKTPFTGPVRGPARPSTKEARQETAKLICQELHRRGVLDQRLKIKKRKMADDDEEDDDEEEEYNPNSRKAGTRKKRRFYPKQYSGQLKCKDSGPEYLHVIKIIMTMENTSFKYKVYHPENDEARFGIISSVSSVPFGPFQLFPPSGEHEVLIEASREIRLDQSEREKIARFQSYLWKDVLKVTDQMEESETREFELVPLRGASLDFDLLDRVSGNSQPVMNPDSVIFPNYKKAKENYFIEEFVPSSLLNADNKMPGERITFRDYFLKTHNLTLQNNTLIRPSNADKRPNVLIPGTETKMRAAKKDLYDTTLFPAELMGVEPMSGGLWRQAQLLPAIIHRLTSLTATAGLLQALGYTTPSHWTLDSSLPTLSDRDFRNLLQFDRTPGPAPEPGEVLKALTLKAANDLFNMERLEILGDSFLKYYTGVFLYYKLLEREREDLVNSEEGHLTSKRSKIVGNRNLYKVAEQLKLEKFVISEQMEVDSTWQPPGLNRKNIEQTLIDLDTEFEKTLLLVKAGKKTEGLSVGSLLSWTSPDDLNLLPGDGEKFLKQAAERFFNNDPVGVKMKSFKLINDKSLADCIESLIGIFLLKSGQAGALRFMSKIGINLSSDSSVEDVLARVRMDRDVFPEFCPQKTNLVEGDGARMLYERLGVEDIEQIIGYKFKEKSFLLQAFTHASYGDNRLTGSYERLEYIGDAVLDYLVTVYVYVKAGQEVGPGRVTDIRSALVNNNMFGSVLVDNKLHTFILLQSPALQHKVDAYVEEREGNSVHRDLKLINEQEPLELELVEVPKVLGDVLEALIGAIYIDSGHNLELVWEIYRKLCVSIDEVIKNPPLDPKKELMEKFAGRVSFSGERDAEKEKMVMVARVEMAGGKVREFRGLGENKNMATKSASKLALRRLT